MSLNLKIDKASSFTPNITKSLFSSDASKGLRDAVSSLERIASIIQGAQEAASPFLTALESDPLSLIVKPILDLIRNTIDAFSKIGGKAFVIHPWNQLGDRTLAINFNFENPVSAIKQYYILYKANENNDPLTVDNYIPYEYANVKVHSVNYNLPKLSSSDAIDDIIASFTRTTDGKRPLYSSMSATCGILMLFPVAAPTELITIMSILGKYTKLSGLGVALNNTASYQKNALEDLEKIWKESDKKIQLSDYATYQSGFYEILTGNTERIANMSTMIKNYLNSSIDTLITSLSPGSSAQWTSLSLDDITLIREVRDNLFEILDRIEKTVEKADGVLATLVKTFIEKINAFVQFLNDMSKVLTLLDSLSVGISAISFGIPPSEDTSLQGNEYLKKALKEIQAISSSTTSEYDSSLDQATKDTLKNSQFTLAIFLVAGGVSFSAIKAQYDALVSLFGIDFNKLLSTSSTSSTSLYNSSISTSNKLLNGDFFTIDINPDIINNSIYSTNPILFTFAFGAKVQQFEYKLQNITKNTLLISSSLMLVPSSYEFNVPSQTLIKDDTYKLTISIYGTSTSGQLYRITDIRQFTFKDSNIGIQKNNGSFTNLSSTLLSTLFDDTLTSLAGFTLTNAQGYEICDLNGAIEVITQDPYTFSPDNGEYYICNGTERVRLRSVVTGYKLIKSFDTLIRNRSIPLLSNENEWVLFDERYGSLISYYDSLTKKFVTKKTPILIFFDRGELPKTMSFFKNEKWIGPYEMTVENRSSNCSDILVL